MREWGKNCWGFQLTSVYYTHNLHIHPIPTLICLCSVAMLHISLQCIISYHTGSDRQSVRDNTINQYSRHSHVLQPGNSLVTLTGRLGLRRWSNQRFSIECCWCCRQLLMQMVVYKAGPDLQDIFVRYAIPLGGKNPKCKCFEKEQCAVCRWLCWDARGYNLWMYMCYCHWTVVYTYENTCKVHFWETCQSTVFW